MGPAGAQGPQGEAGTVSRVHQLRKVCLDHLEFVAYLECRAQWDPKFLKVKRWMGENLVPKG